MSATDRVTIELTAHAQPRPDYADERGYFTVTVSANVYLADNALVVGALDSRAPDGQPFQLKPHEERLARAMLLEKHEREDLVWEYKRPAAWR